MSRCTITDPNTGAIVEIFDTDCVFAGMRVGWHWWACEAGSVPEWPPIGPFPTAYRAYRDALVTGVRERSR
jgi:hypothetical protein